MNTTFILFILFFIFSASGLLTGAYLYVARRIGMLDTPNHRSSHLEATPRGGGVVFVLLGAGWLVLAEAMQWLPWESVWVVLFGWLGLGLLGFLDDRLTLTAAWRFLVQVLFSVLTLYLLGGASDWHFINTVWHLGWLGSLLALVSLLWSINLYNFMDGIDGMAAVEAIFVFGVGGLLLWLSGAQGLGLWAFVIVSAVAGFLLWNWPTAKVFMGDVGSCSLGYLVIIMALLAQKTADISPLVWLILYGSFAFDATVTLVRRLARGEKAYQAHRQHAYQRLHQVGWSHQDVLLVTIANNSLLAMLATIAWAWPNWQVLVLLSAVLYLTLAYVMVERKNPMISVLKQVNVTPSID